VLLNAVRKTIIFRSC